jgi:enoyl-CoA hydratase/carnithine racemase
MTTPTSNLGSNADKGTIVAATSGVASVPVPASTATSSAASAPVLFDLIACEGPRSNGGKGSNLSGPLFIGHARLNRPKALNALNLEMFELMLKQFRAWASDESIVAILLDGGGPKGFCAGGDVASVIREVRAGGAQRYAYGDQFFAVEYELDYLIHNFPKPIISYTHGVCMGGGVGLTVGCSHRVLAESSKLAMPEIHIGLFPDVGGGFFLNRVPGGIGRVMAITGLTINEADAIFAGLSDFFVPLEAKELMLDKLKALPWVSQCKTAENHTLVSNALLGMHRKYKLGLPTANLMQYFDALRFIAQQPTVTELRDALQVAAEEDPYFKGPAESLSNGSPTAAYVSDEYMRRSKKLSLREILDMDLILAKAFQRGHDFNEGVRALLIDKDRNAKWSPARFEEVSPESIQAHFEPHYFGV